MILKQCINCKKEREISESGKSKGLCHYCYKKLLWKPKLIKCIRCERMLPMHAKGYCVGGYNSTFHIDKVKEHNARRAHNIGPALYRKLVKECTICSFDKIVDIHYLDHNHKNSSENNLVGLCPNHHKMLHSEKYQKEIFDILRVKGFTIPEIGYKTDGFIRIPRKLKLLSVSKIFQHNLKVRFKH